MNSSARWLLIQGALYRIDGAPGDALRVLRAAGIKSAPIYYPDPDSPGQAVDTEWKITIYQGAAVAVPNSEWPEGPVQVERGNND